MIIYKFLNVCSFDYTSVAVSGKVERSLTGLTTPVGLTAVTPIGCPKLVRNHCAIDVFGGVFYDAFELSLGLGLSQISSFSLQEHVTGLG